MALVLVLIFGPLLMSDKYDKHADDLMEMQLRADNPRMGKPQEDAELKQKAKNVNARKPRERSWVQSPPLRSLLFSPIFSTNTLTLLPLQGGIQRSIHPLLGLSVQNHYMVSGCKWTMFKDSPLLNVIRGTKSMMNDDE